jgi:hypothetical protein
MRTGTRAHAMAIATLDAHHQRRGTATSRSSMNVIIINWNT